VRTSTPHEARICGTEGRILVHPSFWKGSRATLQRGDKEETVDLPLAGNGYNYEAAEVGRCLRTGARESPTMPLDETLAIVEIMDRIRAQWGLKYPMETL
jgi:predicted dehydrogenase